MGHTLTSAEGAKLARNGFILLLIITVLEVGIALLGNGHISESIVLPKIVMIPVMIALSIYKAYYIVSEFMHLGHETKAMAASVVLPTLLLVWAIIAFLWEGEYWNNARTNKKSLGKASTDMVQPIGLKHIDELPQTISFS